MESITFRDVGKTYRGGFEAVRNFNLVVEPGEFLVLVGPSGCGKTTVLRMLAGLETVSSGDILIGEQRVNGRRPSERDLALIFQNYALYPHMSVFENIAFPLRSQRVSRHEIRHRVEEVAMLVGLGEALKRKPRTLSGGQRQRVAMARALVRKPRAFLMDEPLSNLDAKLRGEMRAELKRLQRELEMTTVYVTHDQVEAMTMGDRIAVMRDGELQQIDSPEGVYRRPCNIFTAGFVGAPQINRVACEIVDVDGVLACRVGRQYIDVGGEAVGDRHVPSAAVLAVRPEHVGIAGTGADLRDAGRILRLVGKVVLVEAVGPDRFVHVRLDNHGDDDGQSARPSVHAEALDDVDAKGTWSRRARDKHEVVWIARCDETGVRGIETGGVAELHVDIGRAQFFDHESGEAIGGLQREAIAPTPTSGR